ncbi:hypothetical protein [Sphingomonas sp. Leaf257]|uniref:hypothetical protein n=1 Tax=Sphingomonas sp. Leaf257 TaxID=1736309 RepID=UPI0012E2E659|nr:hypothetical protein [Sphingomonas sp. Leaf257]
MADVNAADAIRDFLARGGQVTRCATVVPKALRGIVQVERTRSDIEREPADPAFLDTLLARFEALRSEIPDAAQRDADWWAAYEIGPVDPFRPIAEAAAEYVIARDEGKESHQLFRKELCQTVAAFLPFG